MSAMRKEPRPNARTDVGPGTDNDADQVRTVRLGRRALLSLGAAVLVSGCDTGGGQGPSWQTPGGTAGSQPASPPSGKPSHAAASAPPWDGPLPDAARGGVCPPGEGVIPKEGTEQYVTCHGTDIALTIDDGPDPTWTPKVLAVLARYRIRATFCMIGESADRHRDLIAAVADAGHQIANHTYTHPMNLPQLTRAQIDDQIGRTTDALVAAGHQPRLFRAPGGSWSTQILAAARVAGLQPLDWSVDTADWSRPGVNKIAEVILTKTHSGSIILDHDGGGNRAQTVEALGIALPRLLDAGYRFIQP